MEQEIEKILEMVKDGLLTIEEAEDLIETIKRKNVKYQENIVDSSKKKIKFLRILIQDHKDKVDFKIPLFVAKGLLKIRGNMFSSKTNFHFNGDKINITDYISEQELKNFVHEGKTGDILSIEGDNYEIVKISIE